MIDSQSVESIDNRIEAHGTELFSQTIKGHSHPQGGGRSLPIPLRIDLDDNLRLRFCEAKDIDQAVALFDGVWQRESFRLWFQDLVSGKHPNVSYKDFTVVEDRSSGRLVSLMGLISQTWVYGGVPFGCGQPEAIVTHPDYRRKGLVRKQLAVIHQLSQQRGELAQVIWGIPWYYRQFGYEYALEGLWDTHRKIRAHHIPAADDPRARLFKLRTIQKKDYGFIRQLYEYCEKRSNIRAKKSFEEWQFHFEGRTEGAHTQKEWRIIEHTDGFLAGYLCFHNEADSGGFGIHQLELTTETSYLEVMPSLLRQLWNLATDMNQGKQPDDIKFYLGHEHPAYGPIQKRTRIHKGELQCLYMRVQDIVKFLRHIKPALNKNLAVSPASDFSGTLKISLFRKGIELIIDTGHITEINPWKADSFWHNPAFPDLTFLQLVFGRRRCAELDDIYVDCNVDDQSALILDALFPPFKRTMWLGN
jgi:hypothetical protein